MTKALPIFLFLSLISGLGYSQAPAKSISSKDSAKFAFTLQQAIDYAVKNQYSMKNASLDELIASAKVGETRGIGLPQINGSVQYLGNDPLQRMFFYTGNPVNPLVGGFLTELGYPASSVKPNEVLSVANIFQLPVSGNAQATISQIIFNGSYIVGLQAAKTYKELSSKATELSKIQVIENVTKAYYMVLVNDERLKLFDENVKRIDSLLAQTKAMNDQGMVEKIDVNRLMVTYNSIVNARENFKNLLILSNILLKYQMSMPLSTDLSLTQKIADLKVDPVAEASAQQMNYSNRIEYSLLQTQKRLNELDLKNNKWSALPNLSAFVNGGYSTQNVNFSGVTNPDLWYNYGMLGVTLNVPIFSGFQRSYRMQQSNLNLQKSNNDLHSLELSIDVQIKTSEITLQNSLNTLETQNKNVGLAGEVAKVTKIKYAEGVGTSLEVNTAESALVDAQTSYFNALYDALVAKVDYLKAVGKLK